MIRTLFAMASLSFLPLLASASYAHGPTLQHGLAHRDNNQQAIACFSSSDGMEDQGPYTYQSVGYCSPICTKMNKAVFAMTNGNDCWCGDQLPPLDSQVDSSKCSTTCTGFPSNICGGNGYWSVYLTGLKSASQVGNYGGGSSSSSSSSSSSQGSTTTNTVSTSVAPGQTIVITAPASAESSPSPAAKSGGGGGANTAGIAAGIVVGVVAAAAITGGLFFFLRRRRQQAAEEEFKRQNQVSDFVGKPPGTGYSQMSDTRLDPVLNKRDSSGSLADDQDYSRRILRVANPDR